MQSTCLEHQWATRGGGGGGGAAQKSGRPQGNLFYQPDIRLKHTKNNLIDVPEKTTSSFTEASTKITVLRVLSKSN